MLFSKTPFQPLLHRDLAQVRMSISALQFIQHVLDLNKDHLSLAGDFPRFLGCFSGTAKVLSFKGLPEMLEGQRKERDALGNTVDLDPGLCELTCGSVEEQRKAKARPRDPDDRGLGAYDERVSRQYTVRKPSICRSGFIPCASIVYLSQAVQQNSLGHAEEKEVEVKVVERSDETSGHDAQGGLSLLKTVVATGPTLNVSVAY